MVSELRTLNDTDKDFYEALENEFSYVGITFNKKQLQPNANALYFVPPYTSVNLSTPKQRNVFFLKDFGVQGMYGSNPGIDISPSLLKVRKILSSVFNGSFKLGFISEGEFDHSNSTAKQFSSAYFAEGHDPYKAVNRLLNYNRIDALLVSDNITDRATRRKIFVSCLEQNRFAVGTMITDVEDGALASIYYDHAEVINAAIKGGHQYSAKRAFDIASIQPRIKIKVNRSLAKARNISPIAFRFDSAETTYE